MATYLKRTSKLFDLTVSRASAEVNLRDLMCPVCRGILIEPVTLPCTHNLCLGCLKGTFEHNSLSCPLCRVRVGSWLRTATKSETLVNSALWELIRTRFPKEVEGKHNGDEGDIELDSGFTSKKVILSAAGEIRREYEVQLKIAEEEMRRQREAERIANEALIRKIQAEEQQQLAQLAQDQLMAKSLAKKQLVSKEKSGMKYYGEYKVSSSTGEEQLRAENRLTSVNNVSSTNSQYPRLHVKKDDLASVKDDVDIPKSNVSIISKIRTDRYVPVKARLSSIYKESNNDKAPSQKSLPIHNAVTRTLKHQTIAKYSNPGGSNFVVQPSCSNAQNYGTGIKEELHVPKDVLSSKKKSLGVEVCMTTGEDDERIGSAESAGSHDSINQEIHHFKPIKPMARTALKMSYDGRPIDPKLVRVIPILKRVTNAVPKPPSPTHVKRILGCSWSAFRGKARQNLELRQTYGMTESEADASVASTSSLHPHQMPGKLIKSQVSDTVRRLDLAPDSSFDSNKNYAKNINRILNGTKVSKRLIMDETVEVAKVSKPAKAQANKNGTIVKNKRQRNLWNDKKIEAKDERESSSSSPENSEAKIPPEASYDDGCTIENIAERIKRRKVNRENVIVVVESEAEPLQRSTRRRVQTAKTEVEDSDVAEETPPATLPSKRKRNAGKSATRTKRQRTSNAARTDEGSSSDKVDSSIESNNEGAERRKGKRTTRNQGKSSKAKRAKTAEKNARRNESEDESSAEDSSERIAEGEKNNSEDAKDDIDEQIIKEQERMERLILQEKEDFELALRLQAQFNDMERIAGRTRGSRRAMESNSVATNDASVATKTARINTNSHTANQGNTGQNSHSSKQRRRPQKQAVK